MNAKKLEELLAAQATMLAERYDAVSPDFSIDAIHDFRTGVKKYRALLRLAGTTAHKKPGLPVALRNIYHIAGSIRDAQLLQAFATHEKLPVLFQHLEEALLHLKIAWEIRYHTGFSDILTRAIRGKHIQSLATKAVSDFLQEKFRSILATEPCPDDSTLHEVRKLSKDILYVARWVEKDWPEAFEATVTLPLKELQELAEKTGDYNDRVQRSKTLELFHHPGVGEAEAERLHQLRNQERQEMKVRQKAVIAVLDELRLRAI